MTFISSSIITMKGTSCLDIMSQHMLKEFTCNSLKKYYSKGRTLKENVQFIHFFSSYLD